MIPGPISKGTVTQKCKECGHVFTSKSPKTWCPMCNSFDIVTVHNPTGYQTR